MLDVQQERCRRYRRRILEISQQVPAAHVAPAFSCVEIVDALYNEIMRPQDIFIMSKGHGCLTQYVVLEDLGKLPREALDQYCQPRPVGAVDWPPELGAHPDYDPGIDIHASTGSLGHGLGIAAGQALAERLQGRDTRVYVLLSDGECQEGSTWEAAMVASNLGLSNLVVVVDHNNFGGMDRMSDGFPAFDPLVDKWRAFGWITYGPLNGHEQDLIVSCLRAPLGTRPTAIVFSTVKGKGVSFMENSAIWHYRSPTRDEYELALKEID